MPREFIVSLENRPGTLAEITAALGKANVNVTGICCVAQGEFGTVRIVTNNDSTVEGWLRQNHYSFRATDVLTVKAPNRPGEIGSICQKLSSAGVNIEALYGFAGTSSGDVEFVIQPSPEHVPTCRKILGI